MPIGNGKSTGITIYYFTTYSLFSKNVLSYIYKTMLWCVIFTW